MRKIDRDRSSQHDDNAFDVIIISPSKNKTSANSLFSFFCQEVVELGIGSDPLLLVGLHPCIFDYVNSSTISQGRIFFNFDKHDNIGAAAVN